VSTREPPPTAPLAYYQGALNALGALLSLLIMRGADVAWPQGVTCASGIVLILLAHRYRAVWNARVSSLAFLGAMVPVVWLVWSAQAHQAKLHAPFSAFQEHQLCVLTAATLAPSRVWAGLVAIALFAGAASLQYAEFDPAARALAAHGALQGVGASTAFAVALLAFRVRSRHTAEVAWRAAEEARMMAELASTFMAVRDLANSPIQALMLEAEMLRMKHPETAAVADRLRRTTKKLAELNAIIDDHVRTSADATKASFDAHAVLESLDRARRSEH
jgi:multisubunit Na+/H+ antiporter MnhB subunit